jgi:hypothetical protein
VRSSSFLGDASLNQISVRHRNLEGPVDNVPTSPEPAAESTSDAAKPSPMGATSRRSAAALRKFGMLTLKPDADTPDQRTSAERRLAALQVLFQVRTRWRALLRARGLSVVSDMRGQLHSRSPGHKTQAATSGKDRTGLCGAMMGQMAKVLGVRAPPCLSERCLASAFRWSRTLTVQHVQVDLCRVLIIDDQGGHEFIQVLSLLFRWMEAVVCIVDESVRSVGGDRQTCVCVFRQYDAEQELKERVPIAYGIAGEALKRKTSTHVLAHPPKPCVLVSALACRQGKLCARCLCNTLLILTRPTVRPTSCHTTFVRLVLVCQCLGGASWPMQPSF